jgi:hypothetical protein
MKDAFELLRSLPTWVQLCWAGWGVVGLSLVVLTANVVRHPPAGQNLSGNGTPKSTVTIDHANNRALIAGEIHVGVPYGYGMTAVSLETPPRTYRVYAQPTRRIRLPVTGHDQDIVLGFDVTNTTELDLRIADLYVEVVQSLPVSVLETAPLASAGKAFKYFCNLSGERGFYRVEGADDDFEFVKLAKGELERIEVNVNSRDVGVYFLAIWADYSIGAEKRRVLIGRVPEPIGFF